MTSRFFFLNKAVYFNQNLDKITIIKRCFVTAVRPSLKTSWWLLKIMLPISLAVRLLQYYGVIEWCAQWLNPISWSAWGVGNSVPYGSLRNDIRLPGGDAVDDTDHAAGYYNCHHGTDMPCPAIGVCCGQESGLKTFPYGDDTHSGSFHGGIVP